MNSIPPSLEQLDGLDEDYDLVKAVGRGRRCIVYEAICRRGRMHNRLLALKKVTLPESPNKASHEIIEYTRMQQELYHPNILSLYSTFFSPGAYIQIMEYCPEGNLVEYMKLNSLSSFPESMLFSLFRGLSDALVYLKDRQIVHRAIHPQNIYLGPDQRPVGCSLFWPQFTLNVDSKKLTCFEHTILLPCAWAPLPPSTEYTSPEITQGSPGSFPADIWSLACVVYYSLTGQSLRGSAKVPIEKVISGLDCEPQLRDLLSKMLKHSPSDRLSVSDLVTHPFFGHSTKVPTSHVPKISPEDDVMVKQQTFFPVSKSSRAVAHYEQALKPKPKVSVMRRASLDDTSNARIMCLASDVPVKNNGLRSYPTKRIVSDPVLSNRARYDTALVQDSSTVVPLPTGLSNLSSQKPSGGAKLTLGARSTSDTSPKERYAAPGHGAGSGKLQRIDSSCLRPQSHRSREGQVSVLRNRHVLVDFRSSSIPNAATDNKVMIIDPKADSISIYEGPILQDPCQPSGPVCQYSRDALPTDFWYQYRAAYVAIDQMKQRTPKFIMFTDDGKYTQMVNGPPSDVEATFSPVRVSQQSEMGQDDSTMLRIRYSEARGLVEFRRYTGATSERSWMKKSIASIFDPRAIPQTEWDKLDDVEKHYLYRLIIFAETCKMIEDLRSTARSLTPLQDTGLGNQGGALPSATITEHASDIPSKDPISRLLIPRRPNKLFETQLDGCPLILRSGN